MTIQIVIVQFNFTTQKIELNECMKEGHVSLRFILKTNDRIMIKISSWKGAQQKLSSNSVV
jgi:hypothetical protein